MWKTGEARNTKLECYGEGAKKAGFKNCEYTGDFGFDKLPAQFVDFATESFLIYNTTEIMGKFCMISLADVQASAEGWSKNMTIITQTLSKASDYVSDIEESYHYLLICIAVAFVVSILSLMVIRYFAGFFVWVTILAFLISLFVLGYLAHQES